MVFLKRSPVFDHQQPFLKPKNFVPLRATWVLHLLVVHLLFLFGNLHQELSVPLPVLKGCLDSLVQENSVEAKKPFRLYLNCISLYFIMELMSDHFIDVVRPFSEGLK
jgi:hypothetical protein